MDIEKIKSFIKFISNLDINEVSIQTNDIKIYVNNFDKRNKNKFSINQKNFSNSNTFLKKNKEIKKNKNITIKSPMIGTFYRKPGPDKNPFVEIGDKIKVGKKICIIESMKLFNEIESEFDGILIKIFVKDGDPVDYNQPLFLLKINEKNINS